MDQSYPIELRVKLWEINNFPRVVFFQLIIEMKLTFKVPKVNISSVFQFLLFIVFNPFFGRKYSKSIRFFS